MRETEKEKEQLRKPKKKANDELFISEKFIRGIVHGKC